MSKEKYLYDIEFEYSWGKYHSIFSSEKDFSLHLTHKEYFYDEDIHRPFWKMIYSDPNILTFDQEDFFIGPFKIFSKAEYCLSYDKLIPDNLFKSLNWFNQAIKIYDAYYSEEDGDDMIINHTQNAYTDKIFRNWNPNNLKETAFIRFTNRNIEDKLQKIHHAEAVLNVFLKEININTIREYDYDILEYMRSHSMEIKNMLQHHKDKLEEIRGGDGHKPIVIPINNPIQTNDFKINLLVHIGKLVSEIRFILAELLNSIMGYEEFDCKYYNLLYHDRLEEVIIDYKIRLIKEKKKYVIENQEYSISLVDLQKEKEKPNLINDKSVILTTLSPSFKKKDTIKRLLDDIDEHYYISKSVKFPKRKLAIIAYILQHCELFNKMSYETFKQNICWYYGKENISMKPNKIKNEALQEYYKKEFVYKKYNIVIKVNQ